MKDERAHLEPRIMKLPETTVEWFGEKLTVVEPDYLLDISVIANCFEAFGHHPLIYTLNRMKPRANTRHTLLGNFAGTALDTIIHTTTVPAGSPAGPLLATTLRSNFREKALEFATCDDFDPAAFKRDALLQVSNLQQIVTHLFSHIDRSKALLEPSFVCPQLGIQGRIDLMTTDFSLLVEQKSGKSVFPLKHYVQVLLYYGVLAFNFQQATGNTDIRLLYSRFPLPDGLRSVEPEKLRSLMREAMTFRNEVVRMEHRIATEGFGSVYDQLTPEVLSSLDETDDFYRRFELPKLQSVLTPLHAATPLERAYMERMMTFVIHEQIITKVGPTTQSPSPTTQHPSVADLWRMPLSEKREMGNIYTALTLEQKEQSTPYNGYDQLTFAVPDQGEDFMPNFRRGDMVYVYSYKPDGDPDITHSILFKGTLTALSSQQVTVRLNNGQQNPDIFDGLTLTSHPSPLTSHPSPLTPHPSPLTSHWAIEHAGSDAMATAAIQGLHAFLCADPSLRRLLLCQRAPRRDSSRKLTRSYHPDYDEMVEKAMQSQDFFLLVGPPGTGKTSMALRFLVEESLAHHPSPTTHHPSPTTHHPSPITHHPSPITKHPSPILLLSYTNRAVDEICEMLVQAGHDFIRLGHEYSCEPRFAPYLLSTIAAACPKLGTLRERLDRASIIVATTSTINAHPHILRQKPFSRIIIDEASQILEPNIIGILATGIPFILIGDYKQLPAVVQQDTADSAVSDPRLRSIHLDNCRNSLFERLIRAEQAAHRTDFTAVLHKQGRMHPAVAAFSNTHFYPNEHITPVPLRHQTATTIYPDLSSNSEIIQSSNGEIAPLAHHRLLFFPSPLPPESNLSDKVNTEEARIVANLLRQVYQLTQHRFDPLHTVGVIVPYRNQIATIRQAIEPLGIEPLMHITIDTVERYQGSQRDVIIYSFTVTKPYQLDFLTSSCFQEDGRTIDRKLNVVLTRARVQLLLVGHRPLLEQNALFRELIAEATEVK